MARYIWQNIDETYLNQKNISTTHHYRYIITHQPFIYTFFSTPPSPLPPSQQCGSKHTPQPPSTTSSATPKSSPVSNKWPRAAICNI